MAALSTCVFSSSHFSSLKKDHSSSHCIHFLYSFYYTNYVKSFYNLNHIIWMQFESISHILNNQWSLICGECCKKLPTTLWFLWVCLFWLHSKRKPSQVQSTTWASTINQSKTNWGQNNELRLGESMKHRFQRTSALPARSKTSEFSASTECVQKKKKNNLLMGGKKQYPKYDKELF